MGRSRRHVSVLCAAPNGPNPGMASVDLAFDAMARQAGVENVTWWRLWDQSEWQDPPGGSARQEGAFVDHTTGLSYELGRGRLEEIFDADLVVFWGDFLHMAVYLEHTAHVWTHRIGLDLSPEEAGRLARRHLLLENLPTQRLSRVISYGTTLAFNTATDYAGPYGDALRRFHAGVADVRHRDGYSAEVARRNRSSVRPDAAHLSFKGLDAALLLPPRVRPDPQSQRLGVFVGRSQFAPENVGLFGRRIAEGLGLVPRWLHWGREPGFWPMLNRKRLRAAWPELHTGSATTNGLRRASLTANVLRGADGVWQNESVGAHEQSFDSLEADLAACRVILTDTYHLAVNAWRLGVPAICLVDPPSGTWSVNAGSVGSVRDKREDLYSQLDALPLLVRASSSTLRSREEVRRVCNAVLHGSAAEAARSWIEHHREIESKHVVRLLGEQ